MSRSRLAAVLAVVFLSCRPVAETASPSGWVLGAGFVPIEATARIGAPADCGNGYFEARANFVFASFLNVCTDVPDLCYSKATATAVSVHIIRTGISTRPPLGPGTYLVGSTPETGGSLVVSAMAARSDASCAITALSFASAGTITIDSIGTTVRGRVDLAFPSGESFGGTFEALTCAGTYDSCTADVACASPVTCVP